MHTRRFAFFVMVLLLGSAVVWGRTSTTVNAQGTEWPTLDIHQTAYQFDDPVYVTNAGDGSGRIFVVERGGYIRIIKNGAILETPFLDIHTLVTTGFSEQGLLSVVFSPDYETNGEFYVNYSELESTGDTYVVRYTVSQDNPDVADPNSAEVVLTVVQPYDNHNGGQLHFGPDGMLYIGMGDGGAGGDPQNHAQTTNDLLGKMLRIDVETSNPLTYTIPADNPFVSDGRYRPEIWQVGLRNPWRFSFDRETGDMYIGDVGQGEWEEIDFQPASSAGGENWGWRCYEGTHEFNTDGCLPIANYDAPIHDYEHLEGRCSVTGGYVYRGTQYPALQGIYFYADYCSGDIWGLQRNADQRWENQFLVDAGNGVPSFGEDEAGNLYLLRSNGFLYEVRDAGAPQLEEKLFLPVVKREG